MALVIAGGLVSSTVLNMLVLPVLALRYLDRGSDAEKSATSVEPKG